VPALKVATDAEGIHTKVRVGAQGKRMGGQPWFRGALYQLLQNPLYLGQVRHRKLTYPGEHEAIISREIWNEAQRLLASNASRQIRRKEPSPPACWWGAWRTIRGIG
jgi:hypothetical protein